MDSEKREIDLRVEYEKANAFRVIHVDGAHGGVGPTLGKIAMSLYSERRPIPRAELYHLSESGMIRDEAETRTRPCDVFREVEACLILSVPVAKAMRDWLDEKIKELDGIKKMMEDTNDANIAQ